MKVLADSLISQEDVPIELYKEFMTDIAEEIERENKIITDLLSLVKMDKTSANLNIENRNLNELIKLILKRLRPIAKQPASNDRASRKNTASFPHFLFITFSPFLL